MVLFQGIDLSLNHGAVVTLDEAGDLCDHAFFSSVAQEVAAHPSRAFRLSLKKDLDSKTAALYRLEFIETFLHAELSATSYSYVGLEDYAYGAKFQAHQLGEVGGLARQVVFRSFASLRLHDPLSIKLFATGNAKAEKEDMVAALEAEERQGLVKGLQASRCSRTGKLFDAFTDVVDAYFIARLVWLEWSVRTGRISLQSLPETTLTVFNRVTKTESVNLLARPWIRRETEVSQTILANLDTK